MIEHRMAGTTVAVDVRGAYATVALDRPDKLNALSLQLVEELAEAAERVAAEPDVAVVLVRGRGRSFCAGLDLDMFAGEGMPRGFYAAQERGFRCLETMDKIVIAAIQGHCLGGGVQLAAACDIRVAGAGAVLGLPAIDEGLFPGMAPYRLPRLVGKGRAASLILTGRRLDAHEALQIGLVDHVVDDLDDGLAELAEVYARAPRQAAAASKRLIARGFEASFEDALAESERLLEECLAASEVSRARAARAPRRR
jgi:enoyl-CoA hydratase/carnithine racemase